MRYAIVGAAWLWGLWALTVLSDTGFDFCGAAVLLFSGGTIGCAWLTYGIAFPNTVRVPRFRWLFLSVPVIGAGTFALSLTDYSLVVRVWMCESALRECAETLQQNPQSAARWPNRTVGLFDVQAVTVEDDQVCLQTEQVFWGTTGIVYRPDGTQPVYGRSRNPHGSCQYKHLYGPWWRFHESWD